MTSPATGQTEGSENYYLGDAEHTPGHLSSSASYGPSADDKQSKISVHLLDIGDLRHGSQSPLSRSEQASPTLSLEDHFLPPTASTRTETPILPSRAVSTRLGIYRFFTSQWRKHRAPIFVFGAQFFGALMNLFARLLELDENDRKLHPMQLLFWRMLITLVACSLYIVKQKIPHGVLGSPKVRWLLVARGTAGFFGIYGIWYSIVYLPLSEATVITFIAPNLAGYLCHLFLKDPFTRTEQLASYLALGGVVLITKPTSLFSAAAQEGGTVQMALETVVNATGMATPRSDMTGPTIVDPYTPTNSERLGAIGFALLGVLGTSFTFTTLRAIGKRAHPLISVNYFSGLCLIVTLFGLSFAPYLNIGQPELQLAFPSSIRQWALLLLITACGLILQVLTTKGLAAERSNRATAMTYTHILFAAFFDRLVWGTTIGWISAIGGAMIIAGAIWVATSKKETMKGKGDEDEMDVERATALGTQGIEAVPMLRGDLEDQDDDIALRSMR
ncbi:hypothetical protein GGS24DRAFT_398767 [Hypoxylon argillaceum]|nr:hypothetical protein GGS24DRAFT_398767 [Hypoxylon argillaceum]